MDKLGVAQELGLYETCPFTVYDAAKGITCSAEVRMSSDPNEVDAEIQLMHDIPPDGTPPMQQVIWFNMKPSLGNDWETRNARLQGKPIDRGIYNWEEKCCNFYSDVTRFLRMDQIPDIEELIQEHFGGGERFHDQHGGGSSKSPKIKPAQLLGIKKGRGF